MSGNFVTPSCHDRPMDELIAFLRANIDRDEGPATEDPDGYDDLQFFEWARSGHMLRDSGYGDQGGRITAQEAALFQRIQPETLRADCAGRREVVKACEAALTFGAVPGMEGARVLAEKTLRLLAERYQHHEEYDQEWRP